MSKEYNFPEALTKYPMPKTYREMIKLKGKLVEVRATPQGTFRGYVQWKGDVIHVWTEEFSLDIPIRCIRSWEVLSE